MASGGATKPGQRGGGRPPVDSKTRARIRKLAREGLSQAEVARRAGVSRSTVAKVCAEARPPIAFDRSKTAAAVEAHSIDLKAARSQLAEDAITQVRDLFTALTAPHEVTHWDREGLMHRATIDKPTSGDVKNYAVAIGILMDKHMALVRFDGDDRDLPAVEQWLRAMGVGGQQTVVAT